MAQINKSSDYFNTKLYTGTGAENAITSVGFQPDWTWIKDRGANSHRLTDAVRGATKILYSDLNFAEATDSQTLKSFDSDGFTLGTNADVNGSGLNFVSWNWLASNTTASNTDGSITSTVSANTTSGFSIVSYTGTGANATIGHSLGVAPSMIIVKSRDQARDWIIFHNSIGAGKWLEFRTVAEQTGTTMWNNTSPTSSVFSIGTIGAVNTSSENYIAYCFAEKKGFSKFGSYTGNGSTDGTFVYTGFKPSFVIVKKTSGADNWTMADNKRPGYNSSQDSLYPNLSNAEVTTTNWVDFYSNGFKLLRTDGAENGSGQSYIYMAFAESPLVGTNNTPATAR